MFIMFVYIAAINHILLLIPYFEKVNVPMVAYSCVSIHFFVSHFFMPLLSFELCMQIRVLNSHILFKKKAVLYI